MTPKYVRAYVYDRPTITNFDYDLGLVEAWKGLDTFGFIKVPVVPFTLHIGLMV